MTDAEKIRKAEFEPGWREFCRFADDSSIGNPYENEYEDLEGHWELWQAAYKAGYDKCRKDSRVIN